MRPPLFSKEILKKAAPKDGSWQAPGFESGLLHQGHSRLYQDQPSLYSSQSNKTLSTIFSLACRQAHRFVVGRWIIPARVGNAV